jgi:hypothetical protein
MVALLLYSYARGERSSRRIERRCLEDVAARVICANQTPDHTTIARFRQRHEEAIAELFGEVLALCAEAGLVELGVVAVDRTKAHANASHHATRDYEQIAAKILEDAAAVDAEEDEQFGERRGDELPAELSTAQGRRGWLREAKRRLDEQRATEPRPIPRSRPDRLRESKQRLEEEHQVECHANADYAAYRARGRMKNGRRFGKPPTPYTPPPTPAGKVNVGDPESRNVKTSRGWVQGYNAQAVCTENRSLLPPSCTPTHPTSVTSARWSRPPNESWEPPTSRQRRTWFLRTPATGTTSRWTRSRSAAPLFWSRPTPANAKAPVQAGRAAATTSCEECSRPTPAANSTANARA